MKIQNKRKKINDKKKERTLKEYCTSMPVLWTVFILLLILVIVLTVIAYKKDKEEKKNIRANIVIPLLKKDDSFHFNINALALSMSKEYVFKITNYKDDKINDEELKYTIKITNTTSANLKLTKNDINKNLMLDQKSTIIAGETLISKEKEDVLYHVKVLKSGKLENNELIQVEIKSEN